MRSAVGDRTGSVTLNVSEGSIFNSILPITVGAVAASPNARTIGVEEVPLDTLDNLLERIGLEVPLALKIDVQGFERSVLDGATQALRDCRVVEMELSPQTIYEGQMLLPEAVERMSAAGLELSLVENLFPEPGSGRSLQFNGIFVRS
jgi:Methyltransferase FkbM domain